MEREADFLYIPALRNQEIGMVHVAQQREVAVPQRGLTSHPLLGRDAPIPPLPSVKALILDQGCRKWGLG